MKQIKVIETKTKKNIGSYSNETDSEDELPFGWVEKVDLNGRIYFTNEEKKKSQWVHPKSGKQKQVPDELPFGWEKVIQEDGDVVFVDHVNKRKTKSDPRLAFAYDVKDNPHDLRQRFDSSSTCYDVILGADLSKNIAIITGANSGIGLECARALAFSGATIIMACRDLNKARLAANNLIQERAYAKIFCIECDLSKFQSVKNFVDQVKKLNEVGSIILMCNAGIFAVPYSNTEDGYESIFQINYLSHFYLIKLMLPDLLQFKDSRIILVSSESHRFSTMTKKNISPVFLSPTSSQNFFSFMAYNHSKLCLNLLCKALAKRFPSLVVNTCHPGNMVSTNLSRNWWFYKLAFAIVRPFTKSLEQAAATPIFCATAKELEGVSGFYFNNCIPCAESKSAEDEELINLLWDISEDMIKNTLESKPIVTS